jgi:hypothetical protein
MAEADDAPEIVNQILEGSVPTVKDGLFISDLVVHARAFEVEADIVQLGDGLFPCIRRPEGTFAPISFSALGVHWAGFPVYVRRWEVILSRREYEGEGISFVPIQAAREYLRSGMIAFLTSRVRSLDDDEPTIHQHRVALQLPKVSWFGFSALRFSTSGFNVTVSARTSGLRIHSSPTFRRSWSYFGSPTSPIKNALPGGIYEFGADGGAYTSITPDGGTFDIPYKTITPSLNL